VRPYLVGINNPQSSDPRFALYPHNEKAAGYRLWRMVRAISGISREDWLRRTQRNNLLTDTVLPRDYKTGARRRADWLQGMIRSRVTILIGQDVADAFGHRSPPLVWKGTWAMIPHPSGRNHAYNDPVLRMAVGIFLSDVLRYCEEKEPLPRCGDTVEALGQTLTVAWAEQDRVGVAEMAGGSINMDACRVVRRCSDAEHRAEVRKWSMVENSSHAAQVARIHGSVLAQEPAEA
jgi:hypothetical protein